MSILVQSTQEFGRHQKYWANHLEGAIAEHASTIVQLIPPKRSHSLKVELISLMCFAAGFLKHSMPLLKMH